MEESGVKYLTYFDVECANGLNHSICQIGLICDDADSGETVYSARLFVNPEDEFEPYTTRAVHGISEADVIDKPNFAEVWAEIGKYFSCSVVVGHGLVGCDFIALHKQLLRYGLPLPELKYVDTYDIACDLLGSAEKKNLHELTVRYGLPEFKAHDAYNDANATKNLLDAFIYKLDVDAEKYIKKYEFCDHGYVFRRYSPQKGSSRDLKAMRGLIYILRDIPFGGEIGENTNELLLDWLNEYGGKKRKSPYDKLTRLLNKIISAGAVTGEQTDEIIKIIADTVDPVHALKSRLHDIRGRRIFIVGKFSHGDQATVADEVLKRGGRVADAPNKISVILAGCLGGSDAEILKTYLNCYKPRKRAVILAEDDLFAIKPTEGKS